MNLDIFAYLLLQIVNGKNWNPTFSKSNNYKNWIASLDLKTCLKCKSYHGKIWNINENPDKEPPLHPNCRCLITPMKAIKSGTATNIGLNGADWYIKKYNKLPNYYLSESDAKAQGWIPKNANLATACKDKMIFGGIYKNFDNRLPNTEGRIWYEADINYQEGFRNRQRILWSNDGLIFVSFDHYKTFFEII